MRALIALFFGIILITTGCQTGRSALHGQGLRPMAGTRVSADTTVVLLHDSQGPQATRVTMTTTEAASFSQE
ncbi:hypothetical protein SAMN02745146_0651 [Hymenobacter daecheongensis DSM 21074]|uniref:Uncharacterized protein n=1 Tax=Hymenobacter daecheongensis DSM 21074 TaxID=1121955 RepID=A0A1M6AIF2_9BACT|nr:hypothetical protein [Hymenobacter daecheongensis]SHI36256.1 hypothetical protein SAMN02745146_0651 [Hymenobacter daecheongensis DSM 21074]